MKKSNIFSRQGIGFQLNVLLLPLITLILVITLLYNMSLTEDIVLGAAQDKAEGVTVAAASQLSSIVVPSENLCRQLAKYMSENPFDSTRLVSELRKSIYKTPDVYGIAVSLDPEGELGCFSAYVFQTDTGLFTKSLFTEDYDYTEKDWYRNAVGLDSSFWSRPYYDMQGGDELMLTYAVPFIDPETRTRGLVTVDLSLSWLNKFVEDLQVVDDATVVLLDGQGTLLAGPAEERNGDNIFEDESARQLPEIKEVARRMVDQQTGFIEFRPPGANQYFHAYFAPLPSLDWSMAVIYAENQLYADRNDLHLKLIEYGVLGLVLMFLALLLVSRKITFPIKKLAAASRGIGEGNFDSRIPDLQNSKEISRLSSALSFMQQELKQYIRDLKKETAEREKMESELNIARSIQYNMLPVKFPEEQAVDLYAMLKPAKAVGGDLYDFFFLDEHHLCFAIGDVSGKGVPAALFMAICRTLLRAKAEADKQPGQIIAEMNEELCRDNNDSMFVTLFLGILDLQKGNVSYCNAGHNYPLLVKGKDVAFMGPGNGLPLGVFEDVNYGQQEINLKNGETLLLYTDGITEAVNIEEELYSDQRLKDFVATSLSGQDPRDICHHISDDVEIFAGGAGQSDDITLMAVRWNQTCFIHALNSGQM